MNLLEKLMGYRVLGLKSFGIFGFKGFSEFWSLFEAMPKL